MAKYNSLNDVPENVKRKLSNYFSNVGGNTFVIRNLPPELTGGVLARYSRAATGIQLTLVNEFLDEQGNPCQEKGSELMNRVLNAFGDDSVGELEGAHVGIENISQLGTKWIEDRRIGASPIEQSTRYVKYDSKNERGEWRYLRPKEIIEAGLKEKFEQVNDHAFEVYSESVKRLIPYFEKQFPKEQFSIDVERDGETVKAGLSALQTDNEQKAFRTAYNFTIRCAALDVGRCTLPSSTLTQLGLIGNGRYYTNLLNFLKSSNLKEAQERGRELEKELNTQIPTFIKRNERTEKVSAIDTAMYALANELFSKIKPNAEPVNLVPRADLLDEIVSSALFSYTNLSLNQILSIVQKLSYDKKREINQMYKGKRTTRRDRTGRGLEAGYPFTFDLVGGFAEYRDLERHRMTTQQRQLLTTELGFILPPEMTDKQVNMEREILEVVSRMDDLNSDIKHAGLTNAAQYATLFNHRMRFMMGMNLRELQHLLELRTQPAGHFSYRAMCMEMANQVKERDSWTEDFIEFVNYSDPGNKIARAKEQSKIAGKNVSAGIDSSLDLED